MATNKDEDFDVRFYGNDDAPLMSRVPEPPPSHWGVTTSQARTLSPQYIEFLKRHNEGKKNER